MSETSPPYGEPARARLTRQGQVTVPKAVREALGAKPGDDLVFEHVGGQIVLRNRPRRSVMDFAGIATRTARTVGPGTSLTETVEQAVGDAYREQLERVTRPEKDAPKRRSGT